MKPQSSTALKLNTEKKPQSCLSQKCDPQALKKALITFVAVAAISVFVVGLLALLQSQYPKFPFTTLANTDLITYSVMMASGFAVNLILLAYHCKTKEKGTTTKEASKAQGSHQTTVTGVSKAPAARLSAPASSGAPDRSKSVSKDPASVKSEKIKQAAEEFQRADMPCKYHKYFRRIDSESVTLWGNIGLGQQYKPDPNTVSLPERDDIHQDYIEFPTLFSDQITLKRKLEAETAQLDTLSAQKHEAFLQAQLPSQHMYWEKLSDTYCIQWSNSPDKYEILKKPEGIGIELPLSDIAKAFVKASLPLDKSYFCFETTSDGTVIRWNRYEGLGHIFKLVCLKSTPIAEEESKLLGDGWVKFPIMSAADAAISADVSFHGSVTSGSAIADASKAPPPPPAPAPAPAPSTFESALSTFKNLAAAVLPSALVGGKKPADPRATTPGATPTSAQTAVPPTGSSVGASSAASSDTPKPPVSVTASTTAKSASLPPPPATALGGTTPPVVNKPGAVPPLPSTPAGATPVSAQTLVPPTGSSVGAAPAAASDTPKPPVSATASATGKSVPLPPPPGTALAATPVSAQTLVPPTGSSVGATPAAVSDTPKPPVSATASATATSPLLPPPPATALAGTTPPAANKTGALPPPPSTPSGVTPAPSLVPPTEFSVGASPAGAPGGMQLLSPVPQAVPLDSPLATKPGALLPGAETPIGPNSRAFGPQPLPPATSPSSPPGRSSPRTSMPPISPLGSARSPSGAPPMAPLTLSSGTAISMPPPSGAAGTSQPPSSPVTIQNADFVIPPPAIKKPAAADAPPPGAAATPPGAASSPAAASADKPPRKMYVPPRRTKKEAGAADEGASTPPAAAQPVASTTTVGKSPANKAETPNSGAGTPAGSPAPTPSNQAQAARAALAAKTAETNTPKPAPSPVGQRQPSQKMANLQALIGSVPMAGASNAANAPAAAPSSPPANASGSAQNSFSTITPAEKIKLQDHIKVEEYLVCKIGNNVFIITTKEGSKDPTTGKKPLFHPNFLFTDDLQPKAGAKSYQEATNGLKKVTVEELNKRAAAK